jgi:hypothetical protein
MRGRALLRSFAFALSAALVAGLCAVTPPALLPNHRSFFATPCLASGTPVVLRVNTDHAAGNARGAVLDAGLNPSEVRVTQSPGGASSFLAPSPFIEDALGAGATILSTSYSGWHSLYDSLLYQKLTANRMLHVYAYEPRRPQPPNAPPPAAFATVNRIGGRTGDGVEFGVPDGYLHGKGQGTTPSAVTAQLAGLMACLKFQHPDWNWFDVKAALRSTAANFPTGYDPRNYGYGSIDYPAANALRDAGALPLFAPAAMVHPQKGDALPFSVNPFQQSRRVADALFKFSAAPAPCRNEMSLAEITALGGQLILLGDLARTGNAVSYRVTREETAYFVWFTRDAAGLFSRIEKYSVLGPLHLKPQPHYGPRLKPLL